MEETEALQISQELSEKWKLTDILEDENEEPECSQLDLFDLPIELIENILSHLEPRDLINCARTCKKWRAGVNIDSIWKTWCFYECYDDLLMENGACSVNEDSDSEGSTLSPLCYWGNIYCWFKRLSFNWRFERLNRFILSESYSPVYCLTSDGITSVSGHQNGDVAVWMIGSTPRHISTFKAVLGNSPVKSVMTTTSFVAVMQNRLLQIYKLQGDGTYTFTDLKSFELGESNIEQFEMYKSLGDDYKTWYQECLRASESNIDHYNRLDQTLIVGNTLIVAGVTQKIIRTWTLPGSEVATVRKTLYPVRQVEKSGSSVFYTVQHDYTLLVKYKPDHDTDQVVLSVPGKKQFLIGESIVLALPMADDMSLHRLWVWDRHDFSKPLGTKTVNTDRTNAIIVRPHFILYTEQSTVNFWDPTSVTLPYCFSIGISQFHMHPGFDSTILIFLDQQLHLWDWIKGVCLYKFPTLGKMNGGNSKLIWISPSVIIMSNDKRQMELVSFV